MFRTVIVGFISLVLFYGLVSALRDILKAMHDVDGFISKIMFLVIMLVTFWIIGIVIITVGEAVGVRIGGQL